MFGQISISYPQGCNHISHCDYGFSCLPLSPIGFGFMYFKVMFSGAYRFRVDIFPANSDHFLNDETSLFTSKVKTFIEVSPVRHEVTEPA